MRKCNYGFILAMLACLLFWAGVYLYATRDDELQPVIYLDETTPFDEDELWRLNQV